VIEKIKRYIALNRTRIMTGLPWILGVLLWLIISIIPDSDIKPDRLKLILFSVSLLIVGCAGIPMIFSKDEQGIFGNRIIAISKGVFYLVLGWGLSSYILLKLFILK
jgi:hypothetical protein